MVEATPTTGKPCLLEHEGAGLRAVAADHHQPFDAVRGEVAQRLRAAALLAKLLRARAAEERAAHVDDAADVARVERADLILDQALEALPHAEHRHALVERAARDGANGGVHAGRVAAARQDRNAFHA